MAHQSGKQYQSAAQQVKSRAYSLEEAVPLVQKIKFAKFDETVELHMRLGVDPKHADQMVRGTVVLPNCLGKSKKVLVIASGERSVAAGGSANASAIATGEGSAAASGGSTITPGDGRKSPKRS